MEANRIAARPAGTPSDYRKPKLILAIILSAPLAGALVGAAVIILPTAYQLMAHDDLPRSVGRSEILAALPPILWAGVYYGGLFGAFVGIPATLLFGIPTYLVFKRRGRLSLLAATGGGLIPALGLCVMLGPVAVSTGLDSVLLFLAGAILSAGAIGGAIFWLIRRPDRDEAPAQMPQPPAA